MNYHTITHLLQQEHFVTSNSLEEALNAIIETISKLNINSVDKVELMLNLKNFLDVCSYHNNIEILSKNRNKDRIRVIYYE